MRKLLTGLTVLVLSLSADDVYTTLKVEAVQNASLAFDASGSVEKVYVEISSKVKKGEPLAKLKNRDKKASLDVAKSSYENAKVALKYAKKDYDRQLKVKELIDEAMFDKYAFNYEKAKVALSEAKANLDYQQALFNKTTIYAPFSGVISDKIVEVGDVVSGMMLKTIFKIQSLSDRKLVLEFDQKYWSEVKVGDEVNYTLDGSDKKYSAKISKIYPAIDETSRMIKAEVKAKNIPTGLFGTGYITTK